MPPTRRLVALACLALLASAAAAEDLLGVYRQAQENDPVFRAARAARDATAERAPQGRAGLLPSVNLSAGHSETDLDVTTPSVNANYRYGTDQYSLALTQPLYRKQNYAGYRQGEAEAQRGEHEFAGARQDLILRVAQTYLAALAAHDNYDFAVAEKEALGRLLTLARRNFAVGTASLIDVHDTQAAYDLAVAAEIVAANELDVRREALRVLTGATPATLARLVRKLPLELPQPARVEDWEEAARQANPLVLAQQQALESARQELEKSRAGHHPTLDLTAAHNYNDAGGSTQGFALETTTSQIGLVFNLPLYQGGATSSRVRESAARREESAERLDQSRRQSVLAARDAYTAVTTGSARVQALEQALASNQRSLESTLLGYERGVRNGLDVLAIQRSLFRTRRDLALQRYEYLFAGLRLKAAVGTLVEPDLEHINRLLDHTSAPAR